MQATHEAIKKQHNFGHNSQGTKDKIKDFVGQYVSCDEKSQKLNDERSEIRAKVKEFGLDTKAFQDAVSRAKKDRRKKAGYDESLKVIVEALGEMNQDDLFSYMTVREQRKEELREEKAKAKAREEEFKPATERKPKKPIGIAQAEAYIEAHPDDFGASISP